MVLEGRAHVAEYNHLTCSDRTALTANDGALIIIVIIIITTMDLFAASLQIVYI